MARKKIQDMIEELRSWLPNYDHGPDSYPHTLFRLLASLPGGEELEDMGYESMPGIGWQEADQLGRMLQAIENKADVEDLVAGLTAEEEVEESRRRRPTTREPVRTIASMRTVAAPQVRQSGLKPGALRARTMPSRSRR